MTDFNVNEEFWAALEPYIPAGGNYTPAQVAEQFVAHLREHDKRLLTRWLNFNADRFVREEIGRHRVSTRSGIRHKVRTARFRSAVAAAEGGDNTQLEEFAAEFWTTNVSVLVDDVRMDKPLYQLNGEDCLFVAAEYTRTENHSKLHAAFFRAVATKLNGKTVEEVYDPVEIAALYQSITAL